MTTITTENATTASEIAAMIYAHKDSDFNTFMAFTEIMLNRYVEIKDNELFKKRLVEEGIGFKELDNRGVMINLIGLSDKQTAFITNYRHITG